MDEKGFYADTTQFKVMFPYLKYEKTTSETGAVIGFVPVSNLNIHHQKMILEKMTQNNTYKTTEVGLIPNDWEVKRLKEVSEVIMGQSPDSNNYFNYDFGATDADKDQLSYAFAAAFAACQRAAWRQ